MKKVTVIQKDKTRYTFTFDNSIEESRLCNNGRYMVTVEQLLSTGDSSIYSEATTREAGNALYKELIGKGYKRFESISEVKW